MLLTLICFFSITTNAIFFLFSNEFWRYVIAAIGSCAEKYVSIRCTSPELCVMHRDGFCQNYAKCLHYRIADVRYKLQIYIF